MPILVNDDEDPFGGMEYEQPNEDEIDTYMRIPLTNHDEDIILWWKRHSHQCPVLSAMARLYLAIPGTSTASERVFSAAGNLISEKRTRLSCDSIQANMTLRSWSKTGLIK